MPPILSRNSLQKDEQTRVEHLGVAFQGVVTNTSGNVVWSPIIQHKDMPWQSLLNERLNLPVSVNNDCYLVSEALSDYSQQQLGNSFATVLFSQGVGFSLHLKGTGFCGIESSALELGHLRFERNGALCRCGRYGCIEAYASDYGILRLATGESIEDDPLGRVNSEQISALSQAAISGDESASQAFAVAGAALGEGLLTVFTLFDTMPVALVGRTRAAFELMRPGLKSVLCDVAADVQYLDNHLHCFDDAEPLLQLGLTHNTLCILDDKFANTNLMVHS